MFEIGQIFEDTYPPEVAQWCNENNAFINEIESVTKLVDEVFIASDAEYDEEGNLVKDIEYETRQVEKEFRRFQIVAIPEPTQEELEAQALAQAKAERAEEVERLTVEVEGMVFDADETSQARMSVAASSMTDDETNVWVLHDNSVVQVTKAQLLQACRLARIAQSAVWTKPYEAS